MVVVVRTVVVVGPAVVVGAGVVGLSKHAPDESTSGIGRPYFCMRQCTTTYSCSDAVIYVVYRFKLQSHISYTQQPKHGLSILL